MTDRPTPEEIAELRKLSRDFSAWARGENELVVSAAKGFARLLDMIPASVTKPGRATGPMYFDPKFWDEPTPPSSTKDETP